MIMFNRPFRTGNELTYIAKAIGSGRVSGDGQFTEQVYEWFKKRYDFENCLLTTSCTDALEMCAHLLDIGEGCEVIVPSYTFVSSALPFFMAGAKVRFCDSSATSPHATMAEIESLITDRTKAVVVVHYAGAALDMVGIQALCRKHDIALIEDAAQAIDATYDGKPLGSFGCLSTFSFHESKNITCGEGGLLVVNEAEIPTWQDRDGTVMERAEIIREKGTNRKKFFDGKIAKYEWVDIGSSYLPSDILAAYLLSQLESIDELQSRRKQIWNYYDSELAFMDQPDPIPGHNGHIFYLCLSERDRFISQMKELGVMCTSHYQTLHNSPYFRWRHNGPPLVNAEFYTSHLVRLPIYASLTDDEVEHIVQSSIKCMRGGS